MPMDPFPINTYHVQKNWHKIEHSTAILSTAYHACIRKRSLHAQVNSCGSLLDECNALWGEPAHFFVIHLPVKGVAGLQIVLHAWSARATLLAQF